MIERGADWVYVAQITSGLQWLLRVVVLSAAAGVLVAANVWAPFVLTPYLSAACAVAALWLTVRPESKAGGAFVALVMLWWLVAGVEAPLWQAGVVALLLAVHHLGLAYAAAAPPWAGVECSAWRQWLRGLGIYLGVCVAAVALVMAVVVAPVPRGALWVWLGAGGVLAAAVLVRRERSR